jgi:hypothetical protein
MYDNEYMIEIGGRDSNDDWVVGEEDINFFLFINI